MTTPTLAPAGERRTDGAGQTRDLGAGLAAALARGDVVALCGDLGAGKTCIIQGICAGLGVEEVVHSPTFVLLNLYEGRLGGRPLTVYHFDFYRLGTRDELEEIGAAEFLSDPEAVSLVEWADRVPEVLPPQRWEVCLDHGERAAERRIRWRWLGGSASPGRAGE